jgi:hypothetical protein
LGDQIDDDIRAEIQRQRLRCMKAHEGDVHMLDADRQAGYLELLRRLARLDPPPAVMGGFAEDALLAGYPTRRHADLDLLIPRSELVARCEQFSALGFEHFETYFDEVPGRPLVLHAAAGGLDLELGVANLDAHGIPWFRLPADAADKHYVIRMPLDTFGYPMAYLAGIPIRTISPLALYQMRAAIALTGAFGAQREHDVTSQAKLRAAFWPTSPEESLQADVQRRRGEPVE